MEKYHYVIQSGLLLLLCIMQLYSNWGIYIDYSKNNKEPDMIKRRKRLLIAFLILSVCAVIWFIYETVQII